MIALGKTTHGYMQNGSSLYGVNLMTARETGIDHLEYEKVVQKMIQKAEKGENIYG